MLGEKIGIIALLFTLLGLSVSPYPLVLVLSYLIHELGHLLFARIVGAEIRSFKIASFRLSITYSCQGLSYKRELLVQAGGIIFNLLFAALVHILPFFTGDVCEFFVGCNISLALMNLYPVSVLDGGGMLNSVLCIAFSQETAEKIAKALYFLFAVILWLIAVYFQIVLSSNISLLVISVFLLMELCFSFSYE